MYKPIINTKMAETNQHSSISETQKGSPTEISKMSNNLSQKHLSLFSPNIAQSGGT